MGLWPGAKELSAVPYFHYRFDAEAEASHDTRLFALILIILWVIGERAYVGIQAAAYILALMFYALEQISRQLNKLSLSHTSQTAAN